MPTVADRIAQTVVAARCWRRRRSRCSTRIPTGTGPGRSALDAVAACRERCWQYDWVIDLDIRKFFDSVPWDLIVKAVEAHMRPAVGRAVREAVACRPAGSCPTGPWRNGTAEPRRGLRSHPCSPTCSCTTRSTRGWPGSSLACPFERYADDAVVHCASLSARPKPSWPRSASGWREVGLALHPDKTRIVYCKDGNRRGSHEHTSFTFLGFTFRARAGCGPGPGRCSPSFLPAISKDALKKISATVRSWRLQAQQNASLPILVRLIALLSSSCSI